MTETALAAEYEPEPEGQLTVPGLPPGPQFDGVPISRFTARLGGPEVSLPGKPKIGDRGYATVYFRIGHPSFKSEDAKNRGSAGDRLVLTYDLTAIEFEVDRMEDRYGNPVEYKDGERKVAE